MKTKVSDILYPPSPPTTGADAANSPRHSGGGAFPARYSTEEFERGRLFPHGSNAFQQQRRDTLNVWQTVLVMIGFFAIMAIAGTLDMWGRR